MHSYNLEQWLLFFYFYCFCGWIWESCYVSAKKRKWVNRGFIHGPFLPLYGSGAVTVLFLTLPVRNNHILVFFLGMIGATILEYITGVVMEKLFHVRYWDYSNTFMNFKGHICLGASVAWGVFSLILVGFANMPVEKLILMIPDTIGDISAFVLTIIVAVDFTQSFNEAMDLREILSKITERNESLKRLEKRIEVVTMALDEDIKQIHSKGTESIQALEEKIKEQKENFLQGRERIYIRSMRMLKRNPDAVSSEFAEAMGDIKMATLNRIKKIKQDKKK